MDDVARDVTGVAVIRLSSRPPVAPGVILEQEVRVYSPMLQVGSNWS